MKKSAGKNGNRNEKIHAAAKKQKRQEKKLRGGHFITIAFPAIAKKVHLIEYHRMDVK